MAVEDRKPIAVGGLNLAVDPSLVQGLISADGARYDELGAIVARHGRKRMSLSFPNENIGDPDFYADEIPHLVLVGNLRGAGVYYDQRVENRSQNVIDNGQFRVTKVAGVDTIDKWTLGGTGWGLDQTVEEAFFGQIPGPRSGTLTQLSSDFQTALLPNTEYELEYHIRGLLVAGTVTANVTTSIATVNTFLDLSSNGRHTIRFTTNGAPGNFILQADCDAGGGIFFIDGISLKIIASPLATFVPQRLNILAKQNNRLWLNGKETTSAGGNIQGDALFKSSDTIAKFVSHGNQMFIIDSSTPPKHWRRKPAKSQAYGTRVKYDVGPMGIKWPTPSTPKPVASRTVGGSPRINAGIYRFRIALEDIHGDVSNSGPAGVVVVGKDTVSGAGNGDSQRLTCDFSTVANSAPRGVGVAKVHVYLSFSADGTTATEPSAFHLFKRVDIDHQDDPSDPEGSVRFVWDDRDLSQQPLMPVDHGHPPVLYDFIIVNSSGYGISMPDTIYRETVVTEGDEEVVHAPTRVHVPNPPPGLDEKLFTETEVREIRVDQSTFFWSAPGQPQYMERRVRIGKGSEVGIGLAEFGDNVVVFTNVAIYMWDPNELAMRRVPAKVGALSRDSIEETEDGIRFIASDGVPRLFNGATVEDIAMQVQPVFDQEDFSGAYKPFDKAKADEVSTASGKRKFYMTYPTIEDAGVATPAIAEDTSSARNLLIGDASRRQVRWSIDRTGYQKLLWLARESRLVGITREGHCYFLEEGFVDQSLSTLADVLPKLDWTVRWFASNDGDHGQFFKVALDIDTKGETAEIICKVDQVDTLVRSFTLSTTGRQEFKTRLPAHFKGRFLEVRVLPTASANGRPRLYNVAVESAPRGVF